MSELTHRKADDIRARLIANNICYHQLLSFDGSDYIMANRENIKAIAVEQFKQEKDRERLNTYGPVATW